MSDQHTYTVTSAVWIYPSPAGWHFVSIEEPLAGQLHERYGHVQRGWSSLPVTVTVGTSTWNTSIFWSKEGKYLLAIKADVRKKEKIVAGKTLTVSFQIRTQ